MPGTAAAATTFTYTGLPFAAGPTPPTAPFTTTDHIVATFVVTTALTPNQGFTVNNLTAPPAYLQNFRISVVDSGGTPKLTWTPADLVSGTLAIQRTGGAVTWAQLSPVNISMFGGPTQIFIDSLHGMSGDNAYDGILGGKNARSFVVGTWTEVAVPEPSQWAMMGLTLVGATGYAVRRYRLARTK